ARASAAAASAAPARAAVWTRALMGTAHAGRRTAEVSTRARPVRAYTGRGGRRTGMRNRLTAPCLAAVLLTAAAPCAPAAESAAKPDAAPKADATPADTEAARIASRHLKLGLYGRPSPPQTALQTPRFESSVDVIAARPADPNQTMAVFWRQWNLSTG